jgi:quinol-cytochrome oxidoreductase complex cytochrome b subunit
VIHVIAFPLIAAIMMAVHFWRIRKDGGAAGPPPPSRRELEEAEEPELETALR